MNAGEDQAAAKGNLGAAGYNLTRSLLLSGGLVVTVRPMEPRDIAYVQAYIRGLSQVSRHNRFLGALNELSLAELKRLSNLDHTVEAALLAEAQIAGIRWIVGEARYAIVGDLVTCEVALSVGDSWQRRGLGGTLLGMLEGRARGLGACHIVADARHSNEAVKRLTAKFGFTIRPVVSDARLVRMVLTIRPQAFNGQPRALVAA